MKTSDINIFDFIVDKNGNKFTLSEQQYLFNEFIEWLKDNNYDIIKINHILQTKGKDISCLGLFEEFLKFKERENGKC